MYIKIQFPIEIQQIQRITRYHYETEDSTSKNDLRGDLVDEFKTFLHETCYCQVGFLSDMQILHENPQNQFSGNPGANY